MSQHGTLVAVVLALTVGAQPAEALVLCARKRGGAVRLRDACRRKEIPVPLDQVGLLGPPGPAGSSDTPDQVREKFFEGSACPGNDPLDVMVRVGNLCVDVYEASVWSTPSGGNQYGVVAADYPCARTGNDCAGIYARSVGGVMPSRYLTWFQAQQACRNSGKRLVTSAEWQMAAAGTPDPGVAGNGTTTCNTNTAGPTATGSTGDCVSRAGVRDMVGNVWEWVADWVPFANNCPGWGAFSDDSMCFAGADNGRGPGTTVRGGDWAYKAEAGVFAVDASYTPEYPADTIGFRCAR